MEVKESMPSESVLIEKKKIVEALTEKLKSQAGVFVDFSGITVNEDTEMRVKMREANVDYTVIKNTLMRFAIKNVGFDELEPILSGTTSLAVSDEDPIAPARIIKEYADKLVGYFEIKGGFMDGRILSVSDVNAIANIPQLPVLQAQLLGTMLAPIASLAVVLKAIAEKGGVPVDAELAIPPEEPAPAEAALVEPAPMEAAPEESAPAEAALVEPAPVEAAPGESTPAEAAAEEPALVEPAPAEAAVEEPAPGEAAQAVTIPEEAAPVEAAVEEPASAEAIAEETATEEATPEEAAPAEAAVEEPASAEAIAEEAATQETVPEEAPVAKAAPKPRAKKPAAENKE